MAWLILFFLEKMLRTTLEGVEVILYDVMKSEAWCFKLWGLSAKPRKEEKSNSAGCSLELYAFTKKNKKSRFANLSEKLLLKSVVCQVALALGVLRLGHGSYKYWEITSLLWKRGWCFLTWGFSIMRMT